ncbi:MAG: hypothetical protein ACRD21_08465 [Vicinamibacteria bacterium]
MKPDDGHALSPGPWREMEAAERPVPALAEYPASRRHEREWERLGVRLDP